MKSDKPTSEQPIKDNQGSESKGAHVIEFNSLLGQLPVSNDAKPLSHDKPLAQNKPVAQGYVEQHVSGLVSSSVLAAQTEEYAGLSDFEYEERVLGPTLSKTRIGAKELVKKQGKIEQTVADEGPLFAAVLSIQFDHGTENLLAPELVKSGLLDSSISGQFRRTSVAVIAQNRSINNGVWGPEHHRKAEQALDYFDQRGLPLVTFIDTPGADAGESANDALQAHTISSLIARMSIYNSASVGIILGAGYSGGAIPLATTNVLLTVKDAVFNTIQPQGLANIARKQNLTWQGCARLTGGHACQLYADGYVDGVIDYSPQDATTQTDSIKLAILSSLSAVSSLARNQLAEDSDLPHRYAAFGKNYSANAIDYVNQHYKDANFPSVLGFSLIELRYQQTLSRLKAQVAQSYSDEEKSAGTADIDPRPKTVFNKGDGAQDDAQSKAQFTAWQSGADKVVYDSALSRVFERFISAEKGLGESRNSLVSFVVGTPQEQYARAVNELGFEVACYLYNRWKRQSQILFPKLVNFISSGLVSKDASDKNATELRLETATIQALVSHADIGESISQHANNLLHFDALYDAIIGNLELVAAEASTTHRISETSLKTLLDAAERQVAQNARNNGAEAQDQSDSWHRTVPEGYDLKVFLRRVESWKQVQHSRVSEALITFITYFFEKLLPRYLTSKQKGVKFDGSIKPNIIGRRKDFWYRLGLGYCDLQIRALQRSLKSNRADWRDWVELLCDDFQLVDQSLVSADPIKFPGFADSIKKQMALADSENENRDSTTPACGIVTAIGTLRETGVTAGIIASNMQFQAGAIDMASGLKMIALIEYCRKQRLPVIGMVSSGGMQTKEGAGALFSMAAVNTAISLYKRDLNVPILMIGYGDCTGGAQASFVTHPDVETWYVSGANIPFAGQIVVPSYLPSRVTLANYLVDHNGAMTGLLKHPFATEFDESLSSVDKKVQAAQLSVEELIAKRFANETYLDADQISGESSDIERQQTQGSVSADGHKVYNTVQRLLIHARGCTATKLVSDLQGYQGVELVLVQSDPDMGSVAAKLLDEQSDLVCLGGSTPDESYLNMNSVLAIADMYDVDAVHPGIGFLSEEPEFAKACQMQGLNFVGPDYRTVELMGNKSTAIIQAQAARVPVLPGSQGVLHSVEHAKAVAKDVGFPVLLKSVYGGGGKGIERVDRAEDFADTFHRLSKEAQAAFGRGDLYLERFVESMRHIEVQVARDSKGHCIALGIRDCSVQRNNQKIFEESGSTLLSDTLKEQAIESACNIANQVNYIGVGTVEFIFDLKANAFYFMEMNTRLQVEHPVTEIVSGVSIVRMQLDIANGESIKDVSWREQGYAIEARVTAEKVSVANGEIHCAPSPGLITALNYQESDAVQVITTVDSGTRVEPYYDSLVMQVIAQGEDRDAAIAELREFLEKLEIKGVSTNIGLLKAILADEVFIGGDYDTAYLPGFSERLPADSLEQDEQVQEEGLADLLASLKVPGANELKVISPVSGIFYSAASPEQDPFVSEGAVIDINQTICLFEAMKVFRPFTLEQINREHGELFSPDQNFIVKKVSAADGQQVDPGDLLFVISPADSEEAIGS